MGFTTEDGSWRFTFGEEVPKPVLPQGPSPATGYLSGKGRWENWSDPLVYECDSLVRQFFESKRDDRRWNGSYRKRRYTFGTMFEVLFGRKYDSSVDSKYANRLSKVLAYYSTRIQNGGSVNGRRTSKPIYTLSPKRYAKCKPYSLRLRLEWLEERGELPSWSNMAPPNDNLKPGHARNRLTEENMEKRRERAKRRYCEKYGDRSH